MYRYFLPALLGAAILAAPSWAQQKPDFSGTWKLNTAESDFGNSPAVSSETETIQQSSDSIKVTVETHNSLGLLGYTMAYPLDGRETQELIRGFTLKAKAYWEGSTLIIDWNGLKSAWTLSPSGAEMTQILQAAGPQTGANVKYVFEKETSGGRRPNFSGVWKLNLEKSDFGQLPPPESRTDSIEHEEPVLKDLTDEKGPQGDRHYTIAVTTDGRENVNTIEGVKVKSTGVWKGNTLVTTAAFEYQESDVSMINTLKLSEDGKALIVDSRLTSDLGEMDQHFVYDKQSQ